MGIATLKFSAVLFGFAQLMKRAARRYPAFRARLGERDLIAQIKARDEEVGRWFELRDGRVTSRAGLHKNPDITLAFKNAATGASLLTPPINWLDQINAQKDFKLTVEGPEDLTNWWAQTMMAALTAGWTFGTKLADGTMRCCNMTNGGPVFVHVKDGRIVRMTPIEFDDSDPQPWTIRARGLALTPPRKTTLAPHGQNAKSIVYSPDRLLHPMKRVDFDPNGERNPQNRGKSGYVRISWDEALDIVASEIKRLKSTYGPGVMAVSHGSHHTWGNIGYYLSALHRFRNAVGYTQVHHNPDSWEGWYWGAVHHWGYTLRVGQSETYGTVEDCLQNCDMIVFWAADPESTSGSYGAQEGTVRRQWLKNPKLGIKIVHVDPYYNASAQFLPGKWFAPRPTTSVAMAMAIAYVWIKEDLYDKDYVRTHTVGFDTWKDYLLGAEDGVAKTPEWQEQETGVPAKDVRALAREWGRSASISRPAAGATAMAAPAATRPASNGRASWCASPRCRASASPASIWAICNGVVRSTSISIFRAMPTAACRAISKTRRCRSSSTSACRSCRPFRRPSSASRESGCPRRSPTARLKAMPGSANRSSTSSRNSLTRRPVMRPCGCFTNMAARSSRP
jgi:trimethylamine-N-oxide reductase (cytochrome c)